MAKAREFEIDHYLARKAIKWLNKGAKMTRPTKLKPYTYTGRVRKNRTAEATNYEGAIIVGFAKTRNLRDMRIKRDRYVGFWEAVLHFERAYREKYGRTPLYDNMNYGRDFVVERANKLG